MLAILTLCVILYPHSKSSKEKSKTIMTSSNEAYGDIRQGREQEERMDIARADQEGTYDSLFLPYLLKRPKGKKKI